MAPKTAFLALAALCLANTGEQRPDAPVPYRWSNVVVGAGGFAPGIVFSTAAPGLAYLRTDMGGAYRWEDRAGRWVPLMDGFAEGSFYGVESIAPDPVRAGRVYAAVGMHARGASAILRSDDRGTHWTTYPVPFRMGGNEDGRGLGERLAIDPRHPGTLFFGSRHDGLWRSDDEGARWSRVTGFPYAGAGAPAPRSTHGGVGFVLFDPRPGTATVFAAVADRGAQGLYRSADSGRSWARIPGGPGDLLPIKAAIDGAGTLYVTYADGIGPNGVLRGAVWALGSDGSFRDVTPQQGPSVPEGGYIGVATDPHRAGTVYVSTFNRWRPGDTIWRSTDGGAHWSDLGARSHRDTRISPFLNWGRAEAEFGHWIAGLALDPFAPSRLAYTTGATVYATRDADKPGLNWTPWVQGIEQTAIITLASPSGGTHLVTGFGDLGGFVHDDLRRSPPGMHLNPRNTNTNTLDHAGAAPQVLVRSGNVHAKQALEAGLGWSGDGGHHWRPLRTPHWRGDGRPLEENGRAPISVSADGARFYVGAERPLLTTDRGARWTVIAGLPANARITADKVDPRRAWAIDYDAKALLRSTDGGLHFAPVPARGACPDLGATRPRNREDQAALVASPFAANDLFLNCAGALYRSTDGGETFRRISADLDIALFGLGLGTSKRQPAVFTVAARGGATAIWRSLDGGTRWRRINDDAHRWGNRFRVISGDPRIFGRVYIGTDGRGVVYGDAAK
ncbi:WD40/YVTN/BNR-like repeat-containing protein [Sphingomonas sp. S2-65]|uniref:WD40/YVTN/BNR-like repeat-containing protein n=1 Tax=Sphingomonas sp. S2-65 TaxID=2903960 RepID=UPI001F21605C|nr:sialidase family protein [Sphingomonas sp. S2-65]UYY59331.1 hypothetical protein LZ586_04400 [Sphingomonas sp. S2-65]